MSKAVVLDNEDWEMLYINGELKSEGHTLNEGEERVKWFLRKSKEWGFDLEDIEWYSLGDEDEKYLEEYGSAKNYLQDYKGNYE